jgi:hypothetical protein
MAQGDQRQFGSGVQQFDQGPQHPTDQERTDQQMAKRLNLILGQPVLGPTQHQLRNLQAGHPPPWQ